MNRRTAVCVAAAGLQYLLPQKLLTQLAGRVARARGGAFTAALIRAFIARYRVNMDEAEHASARAYASFNDFFTRALRPGARPLDSAEWLCPADGAISQLGHIDSGGQIFQAKGRHYSAAALLAGETALAQRFHGGHFATIYLSPRDYHRVHMPCAGQLVRMWHVPGALFSVNPATARNVPKLFARNERVVCLFDTAHGALALVLVGAMIVGSMATVWHGAVNPPRPGRIRQWDYAGQNIHLAQGAQMGHFQLGSTVVVLLEAQAGRQVEFAAAMQPASAVRMGQALARRRV